MNHLDMDSGTFAWRDICSRGRRRSRWQRCRCVSCHQWWFQRRTWHCRPSGPQEWSGWPTAGRGGYSVGQGTNRSRTHRLDGQMSLAGWWPDGWCLRRRWGILQSNKPNIVQSVYTNVVYLSRSDLHLSVQTTDSIDCKGELLVRLSDWHSSNQAASYLGWTCVQIRPPA